MNTLLSVFCSLLVISVAVGQPNKNKKSANKAILLLSILLCFTTMKVIGQVPPPDKYNTANYPEDRKAIESLGTLLDDSSQFLNDDYIGTGADGKVYYGYREEKSAFLNNGMNVKSVSLVPGTYILRIYNGDAAVRNSQYDVVFDSTQGVLTIRLLRMECYIKQNGKWYFVSGQGTIGMSKDSFEKGNKQFIETQQIKTCSPHY